MFATAVSDNAKSSKATKKKDGDSVDSEEDDTSVDLGNDNEDDDDVIMAMQENKWRLHRSISCSTRRSKRKK